jgi:hypothetical protein
MTKKEIQFTDGPLPALHDQLVVAVDGADRAQLGGQEGQQVLRRAM